MRNALLLILLCALPLHVSANTSATQASTELPPVASTVKTNKPVLIESKVTGSQEQPKVLYIMPWKGITHPISIDNNDMKLALPQFKPIHPRAFQQQVRDFAKPIEQTEK
jgi:hypothetical protein